MSAPLLLVDDTLLSGTVNVVPSGWLAGFDVRPYTSGDLSSARDAWPNANGVLLRSVTKFQAEHVQLMPSLRGVATLSSGTDHVDAGALATAGVEFFTGLGGNAIAVTDWVQWALSRAWGVGVEHQLPTPKRVIVVGCGAVGSLVVDMITAWGGEAVPVDPPLQRKNSNFSGVSLDAAITRGADAITLHVPLTDAGDDATRHLLDENRLSKLPGCAVLNAARGGVLQESAAARLRADGRLGWLAIDTFVHEPKPDPAVIAAADLVSPHIAGHSIEGKLRVAGWPIAKLRAALGLRPIVNVSAEITRRRTTPPSDRRLHPTPQAALDAACSALKAQPDQFKRHRAAHFRVEFQSE
jgi:erythronate-4-phosphate dehydrogenase